jgi:hypothetical protein
MNNTTLQQFADLPSAIAHGLKANRTVTVEVAGEVLRLFRSGIALHEHEHLYTELSEAQQQQVLGLYATGAGLHTYAYKTGSAEEVVARRVLRP